MTKGIMVLTLFSLLWAVTSFAAGADIPDEVWEEIAQNGEARVILKLEVSSWVPEGQIRKMMKELGNPSTAKKLADQAIKKQRENIKGAQKQVKDVLNQLLFSNEESSFANSNNTKKLVTGEFNTVPYIAMKVDSNALSQLQKIPAIKQIELDKATPLSLTESVPLIGADIAWENNYTGAGQTVVVLDTGVDKTHPDLAGKVVKEICFSKQCPDGSIEQEGDGAAQPCTFSDYCDHGTHVAGIVTGVAIEAKLIAAQVFSYYYGMPASYTSHQIEALEWVYLNHDNFDPPIVAINMSLGGGQYDTVCDGDSRVEVIQNLKSAGIATIAASGNNGYVDMMSAPACISDVISVGATDKSDNVAPFSNSTDFLDVLAPGEDIRSAVLGGERNTKSGTSMATPHVAGIWAILKSLYPTASVDEILNDIKDRGVAVDDYRMIDPDNSQMKPRMKPRIDLAGFFAPQQEYTLTIMLSGNGKVVRSDNVTCDTNCEANYPEGELVTLEAIANEGAQFKQWEGDCSGSETSITVLMDSAKTCSAVFEDVYTLTINISGDGEVTSSDNAIVCGNQCNANYPSGQTVTLTANPANGSEFRQWEGNCTSNTTANPLSLDMDIAKTCTAVFETIPNSGNASLTINKAGAGLGVFQVLKDGQREFKCGTDCLGYTTYHPVGTQLVLSAWKKGTDSTFGGWGEDCSSDNNQITVTLDSAQISCTVYFIGSMDSNTETYPVTVNLSGNGQVTSSDGKLNCGDKCTIDYLKGQQVTLQATSATDTQFKQWEGDCSGTDPNTTLTVDGAKTCQATFENVYSLTINSSSDGQVISSDGTITCGTQCNANHTDGTTVTLEAIPNEGFQFKQWEGDCTGTTNPLLLDMDIEKTCAALFEPLPSSGIVSLTINKVGAGLGVFQVLKDGLREFKCGTDCLEYTTYHPAGTQLVLSAWKKGTESIFSGWSGDCNSNNNQITVTLNSDQTCQVHFD